ncbi:MAG: XdhC family protein [Snowella sp.]|nr:XdhC family protein [Snowella sp.]
MTINCYQYLAQVLLKNEAVLATVVTVRGSVPREVGAKMVILSNGEIFSTIGGGAGEAKVIQTAQQMLAANEETAVKQWVEIDLTGAVEKVVEGVCGGKMQVWLEKWSGQDAIALLETVINKLQSGQKITLVTPFTIEKRPYITQEILTIEPQEAFIETLTPPPLLLIVGAGHVGEQLAKVAHSIGFQVAVQDDRPEWANANRYAIASHIFTESIETALTTLKDHTELYVALVTRGFRYDLEALETLLKQSVNCRYIGMIGSQKRVRLVLQAIEKAGIPPTQLQTIYAPIGLDIGALTPEEIAVSIAAELIMVRRGGTGLPLSQIAN